MAKLKAGEKVRGVERTIAITATQPWSEAKHGFPVQAESDSGRKLRIVIRKSDRESSCDCPAWIFRGSKLARERGWAEGLRVPCVHLRTLFGLLQNAAGQIEVAVAEMVRAGRMALVDWEDDAPEISIEVSVRRGVSL